MLSYDGDTRLETVVRATLDPTLVSLATGDVAFVPVLDLNGDAAPEIVPDRLQARDSRHFIYVSIR